MKYLYKFSSPNITGGTIKIMKEKERIVVSGINGFVGHHLTRKLAELGFSVIGIGSEPGVSPSIKDIVNEYYSQNLIEGWPDTGSVSGVIHLAGLAAVGPSFDEPQKYINGNSAMVTNLCEYYVRQKSEARILIVSSGAIYSPDQPMPITEASELGLSSPYAVSKVLTENQATYYRNRGLDCVIARPFNHIGPGQGPGFILPDFYGRLRETTTGTIKVGNIDTQRDYTDVRDIVNAYITLVTAPTLNELVYNICSGHSLSGREILDMLKTDMDRSQVQFEVDPSLVRPTDIQEITGDSSRLQNELGWKPVIKIDQTIKDFIFANES